MSAGPSPTDTKATLARTATLARFEIVVWFLLMLPIAASFAGATPFFLIAGRHHPANILPLGIAALLGTPLLVIAVLFFGGVVLDAVLSIFRAKTAKVPKRFAPNIDLLLDSLADRGLPRLRTWRLRLVANDLSVSAHVRGVITPVVVLSAGAMVGLMRREDSSVAILAHEIAHIRHWDRLFIGLLCAALFNLLLPVYVFTMGDWMDRAQSSWNPLTHLVNLCLQLAIFSYFSRRREYEADFAAAVAVGVPGYQRFLGRSSSSTGSGEHAGKGYFHPSIHERIFALNYGEKVRRPGMFMLFFIAVGIGITFLGTMGMIDEMRASGWLGVTLYAVVMEMLRLRIGKLPEAMRRIEAQ